MIPEWILILTLITGSGSSVQHIPFNTEKACVYAGTLWFKKTYPLRQYQTFRIEPGFICVKTT
jgi:hypothetical protein